ncbi:MAG TPA: TRAP transporter large permease [Alphaproteobacteria bacterium]|jgi:tripartite ATP-independent transporter DctM subunit
MDPLLIGGLGLGVMLALILLQVPIGFAMIAVGVGGFAWVVGDLGPALSILATEPASNMASIDLAVVPLFLLMGSFATAGGLSSDIYSFAYAMMGHRRGGLALATVGGCGLFGAICGSSPATAATFGRVALPEMLKRGYSQSFAAGTIAAGGTLGSIVPPSVIMIIYAVVAEEFILALFVAAIIPAIIAVTLHMSAVVLYVRLNPEAGPAGPRLSWAERWAATRASWAVILLVLAVIGGIYGGVFTVNEAAAVGAALAFLFALGRRRLTWSSFWRALLETASNTAMIYVIIFGASIFTYFINVAHVPEAMTAWVQGLPLSPLAVIFVLLGIYIFLGCIFDTVSAMLITLPFVLPIVVGLGYDPIWWGIINVVVVELGMITPPIGINVFVLYSVARTIPLSQIFRGVMPFVTADVVRLTLLTLFPGLTLWLPRLFDM